MDQLHRLMLLVGDLVELDQSAQSLPPDPQGTEDRESLRNYLLELSNGAQLDVDRRQVHRDHRHFIEEAPIEETLAGLLQRCLGCSQVTEGAEQPPFLPVRPELRELL